MFKANKFLAIIVLFFFAVSMGSCGGGGGGGGSGSTPPSPPPSTGEPTPPPPQTSTTDSLGQASFTTSQGQNVTFKVQDSDNQQAIHSVSVFSSEEQNNNIFAVFEDSSGKYVPTIYLDTLVPASQSSSEIKIQVIPIGVVILIGLTTASLAWAAYNFHNAIVRIQSQIKDFNDVGNNTYVGCITVKELAQLLWDRNAGAVAVADTLLSFGGLEKTLFKIVGGELAKFTLFEFTEWTLKSLYKNGITSSFSNENEKIGIKIFTMDAKRFGFYGAYEILPAYEVCNVNDPPLPPKNLQAVAVSSKQIDLSWDDTANETNYVIEYSLDGNSFKLIPSGGGPNITVFSHIFLSPSTTYYYRVRASNAAGISGYSNVAQATTLGQQNQPPIISSLTANPSTVNPNGTSTVTCNASDPDNDPLTYSWAATGGTIPPGSGSVVTWTAPSTAGNYTVTCTVSDGKGGSASNGVNINVSTTTLPAPTGLTATPKCDGSTTGIELQWNGVTGATNYEIYRDGSWIYTTSTSTPYFWNTSGLTAGQSYQYQVKAKNDTTTSDFSNTATAIAPTNCGGDTNPPSIPSGLTAAAVSSSQINLSWNASTDNIGVTGYKIYDWAGTFLKSVTLTSTSFTGLTPNTNYCFTVSAYDAAGNESGKSNQACATTLSTQTFTLTVIKSGTGSGTVTSSPTGINCGSTCTVSFNQGTSVTLTASPASGSTFAGWSGACSGTGTCNVTMDSNKTVTATFNISGSAPTVTTATYQIISSSSAQLLGTVNPNGLSTTGWFQWGTTTSYGNTTSAESLGSGTSVIQMTHTISGFSPNTTYHFRAVAQNSAGTSYGADMSFTTPPSAVVPPTVTTEAATSVTSSSATLNGTVNPNGAPTTGWFQWGTTTSYGNTTPTLTGGSGTSPVTMNWIISSLSPNTTYHFRAVAQNSAGTSNGSDRTFTTSSSTPTERITNGSFSSGPSGWVLGYDFWAGTDAYNYRTAPGYASGGTDSSGYAKNNAYGYMYQTVTIPSNATSATLSFWYNITSDETGSTPYDVLNVTIQNSSGNYLATVATYSNVNKGTVGVYNQKIFDVTSYKGQTIRVHFLATTNSSNYTVFRIDDVSLQSDGN